MRLHLEVVLWRGAIAESRHHVQAAVCDAAGGRAAETGHADALTTFRSAAKPFQLLPLVERGHAERYGFGPVELALMAASHTGSERHLEVVRGILERIGLGERDLACGAEDPLDPEALRALQAAGAKGTRLHHNCSGKHAGMLALCRAEGWPTAGYERAEHPLQKLMHRTVAEVCGVAVDQVPTAVDGCGVRVFAVPLSAMARGYARLASAAGGDARGRALAAIREAMRAHPWAVGGERRFSTALMEAVPELVAKGGAEGLECVGWPARGWGLAVRCEDGASRAAGPATIALLDHLGALAADGRTRLTPYSQPVVRNAAGDEVGAIRAELRILAGAES